MNGEPEAAAMEATRSAIWRTAIDQRLSNGNGPQAITLFDRVKGQLASDDRRQFDLPIQQAVLNRTADQWIEREGPIPGIPLTARLQDDPALSPPEKALVRLEARRSRTPFQAGDRDAARKAWKTGSARPRREGARDGTRQLSARPHSPPSPTPTRMPARPRQAPTCCSALAMHEPLPACPSPSSAPTSKQQRTRHLARGGAPSRTPRPSSEIKPPPLQRTRSPLARRSIPMLARQYRRTISPVGSPRPARSSPNGRAFPSPPSPQARSPACGTR